MFLSVHHARSVVLRCRQSTVLCRPRDAIYSRIDEDWKTQEEVHHLQCFLLLQSNGLTSQQQFSGCLGSDLSCGMIVGLCSGMLITCQCCSAFGDRMLPMHSFCEYVVVLLAVHASCSHACSRYTF